MRERYYVERRLEWWTVMDRQNACNPYVGNYTTRRAACEECRRLNDQEVEEMQAIIDYVTASPS
jgi:hypothetical protein